MILTISTTHQPATDLGFLLHKNPDRHQTADLSFGTAHVLYPEAGENRSACLFSSRSTRSASCATGEGQAATTSHSPST